MPQPRRRRNKNTRRSDALFGYLIPGVLSFLVVYQQITVGTVDRWALGSLVVFGLGSLGWNIDVLFEKWIEARYRARDETQQPPEGP